MNKLTYLNAYTKCIYFIGYSRHILLEYEKFPFQILPEEEVKKLKEHEFNTQLYEYKLKRQSGKFLTKFESDFIKKGNE